MKKLLFVVGFALAGLSTPAVAQSSGNDNSRQSSAQAEQAQEAEDEEYLQEVVCKTEPILGSRTRVTRTCMTRQEWNYTREQARREANNMDRTSNRNAAIPTNPGTGL